MFVRAEILLAKHDGLTVPLSCLETRGDESFVFVLKDKRAIHVRIRPGAQQDGKVEIKSGLSEGQLVINKGAHFLSDRDPVDTTENR
jgi:HlyD family secretion protein